LQGELVVEDAHQAQVHLKQALAMGVVGAICALAAVPLFAAALVDALRTFADWSLWSSCLAVAALLTVLAVVFVGNCLETCHESGGIVCNDQTRSQSKLPLAS
jgi:hypothetical protein